MSKQSLLTSALIRVSHDKIAATCENEEIEECRISYRMVRVPFRKQCDLPVASPCRRQSIWWKNWSRFLQAKEMII